MATARDIAQGKPVASLGALYGAEVDPSVPQSHDQPLEFRVWVHAGDLGSMGRLSFALHLHPRDVIVSSKASQASADGVLEGVHVRATATMSEASPGDPRLGPILQHLKGQGFKMKLTLRVEDDRGNVFERTYHPHGTVLVDRAAVGIPDGLELPEAERGTYDDTQYVGALRVVVGEELHATPVPEPSSKFTVREPAKEWPPQPTIVVGLPIVSGGATMADVDRVIANTRTKMRACYMNARKADARRGGEATLTASVASDGHVADLDAAAPSLGSSLGECVRRVVRGLKFSPILPPEKAPANVTFKVTFTPPS